MRVRIALTLACMTLTAGIAACGGSSGGDGSGDSARLVLLSAPPGDDFYATIERSAKAAARRAGADLEIQKIPKWEADAQVPVLNAAIAKKPDAILVNPVDKNSLQAPLEQAASRGIKIVTYDTTIRDPDDVIETYVSSDIEKLGRTAAQTQLDLIDSRGKVFYQGTQPNQAFFDTLQHGWKTVMATKPEVTQLPVVYSDWEPAKASSQMEATLTANPDLRGGFAGVYVDQQGEVPALKRAGKLEQVKLVGVDGAPENVQRLKDGELAAIVSVKAANYGNAAIRSALRAVEGEDLPPKTLMGQCVLTRANVDDPANADCLYAEAQS